MRARVGRRRDGPPGLIDLAGLGRDVLFWAATAQDGRGRDHRVDVDPWGLTRRIAAAMAVYASAVQSNVRRVSAFSLAANASASCWISRWSVRSFFLSKASE